MKRTCAPVFCILMLAAFLRSAHFFSNRFLSLKKYNFSREPSVFPEEVIIEIFNYNCDHARATRAIQLLARPRLGTIQEQCCSSMHRSVLSLALLASILNPAKAQLIPINPGSLSSPPYGYLKESTKRLAGPDIKPNRYISFLGAWENNGEANWERSTWWGRFYIDCMDATFKVKHFRHSHIGNEWRSAWRNYTALYAVENLCPQIQMLPEEVRSINDLNQEFTKDFHNKTAPFKAVY